MRKTRVGGFSPGQVTESFPDGAPQRECFESDSALFKAEAVYEKEWRLTYSCTGCGSYSCPQCSSRPKHTGKHPTPWHLEGPFDLDGHKWGSDIVIMAADGDVVMGQWGLDEWAALAERIVNTMNRADGHDCPARPPRRGVKVRA